MTRYFVFLMILFPAFGFGQNAKKKFPDDIKGKWYISKLVFNADTVDVASFETLVNYYWNQEIISSGQTPDALDSLELEESMPEIQQIFEAISNVTLTFYDSAYNMIIPDPEFGDNDTGTYVYNKTDGSIHFNSGDNMDLKYNLTPEGFLVGVLVDNQYEKEIAVFSRKKPVPKNK